jgi:hypothetical protein
MPRALVAAAVVLIALVGGGLWWVSHLQAIEFAGTGGGGSLMKRLPSVDADEYESDPPPTYGWHTDEKISFTWEFHNSLSIPITITGADPDGMGGTNQLSAPALYQPKPGVSYPQSAAMGEPLHSLTVPADGSRNIMIIWHTRGSCDQLSRFGPDGSQQFSAIHLRYTVLGLFHKSQWVNLYIPDDSIDNQYLFGLNYPRRSLCPDGYPLITYK